MAKRVVVEQSSGTYGASVVAIVLLTISLLYWLFALVALVDTKPLLESL